MMNQLHILIAEANKSFSIDLYSEEKEQKQKSRLAIGSDLFAYITLSFKGNKIASELAIKNLGCMLYPKSSFFK